VQIDFLKMVDASLIEKAKNNDRDYGHFHPSEWGKCHRKIAYEYYEFKGYITTDESSLKISPQLERIFGNGHHMHDRWTGYIESTGALIGKWICIHCSSGGKHPEIIGKDEKLGATKPNECKVCKSTIFKYIEVGFFDEETWWGGHVDAVVDISLLADQPILKNNNKDHRWNRYIIIDYKSMNPFDFKKIEEPTPEHNMQMQVYLYLSDLKYGKFIYENKAFQDVKEFLVIRDDALLEVEVAKAKFLKSVVSNLRDGKRCLPKRAYNSRGHKNCLYCQYRGDCWKNA